MSSKSAVLWTGGKDSALALYRARQQGYDVCCLVTFAPPEPDFLAHPLSLILKQAESIGLPHHVITIHEPFEHGYEKGLAYLRDNFGIQCVITGDIAAIDDQPNWIRERCKKVSLEAWLPLWGQDRHELLTTMRDNQFDICISCVNLQWLGTEWVGRRITHETIEELTAIRQINGLDLCGEQGEYHTMALDGPIFTQPVLLPGFSRAISHNRAYMVFADCITTCKKTSTA